VIRARDRGASEHLKEKVETVKAQMRRLKQLGKQMAKAPDEQISLTDPDARSMATSARGSGVVGYNVQTAVDAKHHLVVTHEVTNQGTDPGTARLDGPADSRGPRH